jgi:hypothetical protein
MEWIIANKDWFFSGVGVLILGGLVKFFTKPLPTDANSKGLTITNNFSPTNTNAFAPGEVASQDKSGPILQDEKTLDDFKNITRILFIDDDARFKVAKILAKSGWVHTKLIKDAATLDDADIFAADILFIDVQGVGVELGFNDEGLGLALALKSKYPKKKVVIYSAETKGDRFHAALRKADSFLPKNADPYEFQKIVEDFTIGANEQ